MSTSQVVGRPVYLVDGCRTPFLKVRGVPGPFSASDLAVAAGRPLLARQPFPPDALDEVVLGCVSSGVDEANVARVAALRLGVGERVPAWTVQRNCASGMQAVDSAAQDIATGRADLVLAGGTEAMSHYPLLFGLAMVQWLGHWYQAHSLSARARLLARLRPSYLTPVVALLKGLKDPNAGLSMGQTAEQLVWRFGIGREAMDRFAVRSHQRFGRACEEGAFDSEIASVFDAEGNVCDRDDGYRADSDMEKLSRLRPVFDRPTGKVTAGNSAQVTDGAALLLLASEAAVERHGLQVLARVRDSQWAALDPAEMGLGPVHAAAPLLQRNGLATRDIDHWEINEAFAAQVLACQAAWSDEGYRRDVLGLGGDREPITEARLNPDGGAIAVGHPLGASGARILLHLALRLKKQGAGLGLAAICVGGGQGGAMLIERAGEQA